MDTIAKYFNAERTESIVFVLVGLTAAVFASYFLLKIKQPFYNGISYALLAIALIQITVGISIFVRSPKDIERVNQILNADKSRIEIEEIPRMNTVMKNFAIYKWIEISLIAIGLVLFFIIQPKSIWKGVGLGLFIQSSFMLLLDFFAESRGRDYLEYLRTLI